MLGNYCATENARENIRDATCVVCFNTTCSCVSLAAALEISSNVTLAAPLEALIQTTPLSTLLTTIAVVNGLMTTWASCSYAPILLGAYEDEGINHRVPSAAIQTVIGNCVSTSLSTSLCLPLCTYLFTHKCATVGLATAANVGACIPAISASVAGAILVSRLSRFFIPPAVNAQEMVVIPVPESNLDVAPEQPLMTHEPAAQPPEQPKMTHAVAAPSDQAKEVTCNIPPAQPQMAMSPST
jgi:hypothetical protein